MPSLLQELQELYRLREALQGRGVNTTELERNFLMFSAHTQKPVLTVHLPKMYPLEGEQPDHVKDVLGALTLQNTTTGIVVPSAIDISGGYEHGQLDTMMFVSTQQLDADHHTNARSYLIPLIERIYSDGAGMIQDFGLHEALFGVVACKRGDLDLREVHLFPEKFLPGTYTLSVKLDTPKKTVRKFMGLARLLKEFAADPQDHILDPEKVKGVVEPGVELRGRLGSLSRYSVPDTQEFSVSADTALIVNRDNTLVYLYAPKSRRNALLYFGARPFTAGQAPRELIVFNGKEHEHALVQLLELDILEPSLPVLEQRIKGLTTLYESAARGIGQPLNGVYPDFNSLMEALSKARDYLDTIVNPESRKAFALRQPPELLEFMVYPATSDPVIHDLLPRLSWNGAIRVYHNTFRFISEFQRASETRQNEILHGITTSILFNNQQNNDVNVWLYKNHKALCEAAGVTFTVQ